MGDIIKPLLATEAPEDIRFPVFASTKLDGIRGIIGKDGILYSRSGKPIPNKHVQAKIAELVKNLPEARGLDGELIVGEATAKDVFRVTTSAVMSHDGEPDFSYYVFDHVFFGQLPFTDRFANIQKLNLPKLIKIVDQSMISNREQLDAIEEKYVTEGYEGLIIRDPNAKYKHGRSSAKEGILLKVRRFKDSEAEVVGFEEEMENQNEAKTNVFGRTERSTHKDNKVGKGSLGSFYVRDVKTGQEFQVGTGYTRDDRQSFWKDRQSLIGKIVKYRYFAVGVKDLPRFPVFQGFRDKRDMS